MTTVYEVEVSDHYNSWGAAGKLLRPGIYWVTHPQLLDRASADPYITVRPLPDHISISRPLEVKEIFDMNSSLSGVLGRRDFSQGEPRVACPWGCGVTPFKGDKSLMTHVKYAHGGELPPAPQSVIPNIAILPPIGFEPDAFDLPEIEPAPIESSAEPAFGTADPDSDLDPAPEVPESSLDGLADKPSVVDEMQVILAEVVAHEQSVRVESEVVAVEEVEADPAPEDRSKPRRARATRGEL